MLHILEHIDQGLGGFRLWGRMLVLVRLHLELDLVRTTSCCGARAAAASSCAKRGDAKTAKKMAATMVFIMQVYDVVGGELVSQDAVPVNYMRLPRRQGALSGLG